MDLYEIINSIEPGVKVNIDKPFINELDNLPFFVNGKTIEELHLALETLVFLNRNADIVLDEFQFGSLCYTIASNNEFEMLKYIIDNKYFLLPNNTCS
jgi:hypothetical protein